jgi:predicted AlkP superfamily pyrophosphatase or phosphodiesterase
MANPHLRRLVLIVTLASFFGSPALLQSRSYARPEPQPSSRPRLVLLIVVDQFRYDYLTRFGDLFGSDGLRRLQREGAFWTNANFDHVPTFTAPGHAVFMTGAPPAKTGIIANDWYEQTTGRKVKSITDDDTLAIAGKPGDKGRSPRRLMCSTVGDELKAADGNLSKVIGISAKDRSAILPAGKRANAAYWFSTDTGNMMSSSYYFERLPDWVTLFNNRRLAEGWFGARWDRLLSGEREYLKRAGKDDVPWENLDKSSSDTNYFPHVITGGAKSPGRPFYKALDYTPFSNDLLVAFAEQAITNEKLGADDETDLLSVSFSANDYAGHRFGPYSQEAMDMTLRVDRQIAKLLNFIDAEVGLRNAVVVFTADHGVAPVPEWAANHHFPGRRYQKKVLYDLAQNAIHAKYARKDRPASDYIRDFSNRQEMEYGLINLNFYLNHAALERDGVSAGECERVIGEAIMKLPGLARYFTRAQLEAKSISPGDVVGRRVLNGFYPERSGDVIVVSKPYTVIFDSPDDPTDPRSTATHNTPYSYDTHVPLIMMGAGFRRGRYSQAASPGDIAPTLARLLKIHAPDCSTGRVLFEAEARAQQRRARPGN